MAAIVAEFFRTQAPLMAHQIAVLRAKFGKADLSEDEIDAVNKITSELDFAGWATLSGDVEDIIGEVTKDGAHEALRAAALDVTANPEVFNVVNQDAVDFAEERSAELVGMRVLDDGTVVPNPNAKWRIDEPTRDMIRGTIADALTEGWSTQTIADKLQENYAFSDERAMTIARTEIIRASNTGTLNGFQQSGVVQLKEWTTFDPCPICEDNEADGPIGLNETFSSDDDAPPAHPNCKCALVGLTEYDIGNPPENTDESETEE